MGVGLGGGAGATADLLWEAGRLELRPDAIRQAFDDGAQPDEAAALARTQGLGPMLWRALGSAGCTARMGGSAELLGREAQLRRVEAVVLIPHAVQMSVGLLRSSGFEPVVFKGPSLAARYPEPGLRSMVDLDVLLPAAEHRAAVSVLERGGWSVIKAANHQRYETVLLHPSVPDLFLELHRALDGWYERSTAMSLESLWERRIPIDCFGTAAFGLPAEVEILALAAHAGKPYHCFSRLIWAVDLVVVDRAARSAGGAIDWDLVRDLAIAWRCQAMTAVALSQASRLGLECPGDLKEVSGSSLRKATLAPLFDPAWPLASPDTSTRHRMRYALSDGWLRRSVLFIGFPVSYPLRTWPRTYASVVAAAGPAMWRVWRNRARPS